MSGALVDRLIPSVEEAQQQWRWWTERFRTYRHQGCGYCTTIWQRQEAASVALDMANAQASDRRRAEADEIRRSVAWA